METVLILLLELGLFFIAVPVLGVAALLFLLVWDVHVRGRDLRYRWTPSTSAEEANGWSTALSVLRADPSTSVECPECGEGLLRVDSAIGDHGESKRREYATCRECGELKVMPERPES